MMQIFSLPRRHLMYWAANLIMLLGKDNLYIYNGNSPQIGQTKMDVGGLYEPL